MPQTTISTLLVSGADSKILEQTVTVEGEELVYTVPDGKHEVRVNAVQYIGTLLELTMPDTMEKARKIAADGEPARMAAEVCDEIAELRR